MSEMNSKITPSVLKSIEDQDPNSYVRVWCKLHEPALRDEYRQILADELFCTHYMHTAFLCTIEVPIKYLDRVAEFEPVREISRAAVF